MGTSEPISHLLLICRGFYPSLGKICFRQVNSLPSCYWVDFFPISKPRQLHQSNSLHTPLSPSPFTMSSPFFPNVDPMQPVKPSFHPSSHPTQASPVQHTQNPKIVGTSVLGLKYKDGIILAADNLGIHFLNYLHSRRFCWWRLIVSFVWESCEI